MTIPKDAEVHDVDTGELLDDAALAERMRAILAKQMEVMAAEDTVGVLKSVEAAAKEKLDEARATVTAVKGELYDLIRGQQLLF